MKFQSDSQWRKVIKEGEMYPLGLITKGSSNYYLQRKTCNGYRQHLNEVVDWQNNFMSMGATLRNIFE